MRRLDIFGRRLTLTIVTTAKLETILRRPLILGASVSADFLTESPGKRVALRYTSRDNIRVQAGNGRRGGTWLNALKARDLKDRSVLIGVDTFFWDSLGGSAADALKSIDHLVRLTEEAGIPLILGEVPELVPFLQKSAAAINAKLHEVWRSHAHVHLLSVNEALAQIARDGYFDLDGKRHPLHELFPDGLHIGEPVSRYLASEIETLLRTTA